MANGHVIHDDLKLEIIRENGEYRIEFTGVWLPTDIRHIQNYITMQYRANRHKIKEAFKKSAHKFKQKENELKVRERDIAHKETKLSTLEDTLNAVAGEEAEKFNRKIGVLNDGQSEQSGTGISEQSSGTNTSGNGNAETNAEHERKAGSQQSASTAAPSVVSGPRSAKSSSSKASGKASASSGAGSGKGTK